MKGGEMLVRMSLVMLVIGIAGCAGSPVHNIPMEEIEGMLDYTFKLEGIRKTTTTTYPDGRVVKEEVPVYEELPVLDCEGKPFILADGTPLMIKKPITLNYRKNMPVVIPKDQSIWGTLVAAGLAGYNTSRFADINNAATSAAPKFTGAITGNVN